MTRLPSKFELFAAHPFGEDDLSRLTADERQVLLARRQHSVVQTAFECGMSARTVHRKQTSIRQKLEF